jgi:hypothetical protein
MAQIADYYGVTQTGMGLAMRRLGIESRGRGRRGTENGRYKDGTQSRLYRLMIEKDRCEECGATYPRDARTLEGPWHELHCSLHTDNIVDPEAYEQQ